MHWRIRGEPKGFVAPLVPTVLWLWLRFKTPRKGLTWQRLGAKPDERQFLAVLFVWLAVGLGGIGLFRFLKVPLVPGMAAYVGWFCVLFWQALSADRKRIQRWLLESEAAVRLWDEREADLAGS
jgi:hypothetical protein